MPLSCSSALGHPLGGFPCWLASPGSQFSLISNSLYRFYLLQIIKMQNFQIKLEEESSSFFKGEAQKQTVGGPISKNKKSSQRALLVLLRQRFATFIEQLGPTIQNKVRNDVLLNGYAKASPQAHDFEDLCQDDILKILCERAERQLLIDSRLSKIKHRKLKWKEVDFLALIWILSKYADKKGLANVEQQLEEEHWREIAAVFPGTTWEGCMIKWLSLKRACLNQKNWRAEQSKLLADLTSDKESMTSENWKYVSYKLYCSHQSGERVYRSPKQCREHWISYLDPNLKKGRWAKWEDLLLLRLVQEGRCTKKWSQIVNFLGGRTQNSIKNRYVLIYGREKSLTKQQKSESEIVQKLIRKIQKQIAREEQKKDRLSRQSEQQRGNYAIKFQFCSGEENAAEMEMERQERGEDKLDCALTRSKLEDLSEEYGIKFEAISF